MTTFTIDTDNNITAFAAPDQAEALIAGGAQPFATTEELTQLAAGWPAERLLAIWNSLPGVTPAKGFKNPKAAASKIWGRIQIMAEPEPPVEAAPKAERKPKSGAQGAKSAPAIFFASTDLLTKRRAELAFLLQASSLGGWVSGGEAQSKHKRGF